MSIKDKIHELKKELLLEEASKQFEEIGYEHMKVADLAKTAQVSVGTIYALFNSKEGLYLAYIEHQINNFYLELEDRALSKSSPKEKIHTFIELNPTFDEAGAMRMAFGINGFSDGYISQWLELNDNLMSKVDEVSELFNCMVESYHEH